MAMSFLEQAKRMFPQMPYWVLASYAKGMSTYGGDAELAWQHVRQNDKYDKTFAGNRRDDGSLRMNEIEYLAVKDGYKQTVRDYGLNPEVFEDRWNSLIEGDISTAEFAARLEAANTQIVSNTAAVKKFYADNYGINLTDKAIFASFIDPDVGRAVLEKRIAVSQIGGEAEMRGFTRSVRRAEELAGMGVTQEQARGIYSQAQAQLGSLDTFAKRFNDDDSTFGLGEFEDAALGDASQAQRADRLIGAEKASFSGSRRVREDQDGGLSGLRQR